MRGNKIARAMFLIFGVGSLFIFFVLPFSFTPKMVIIPVLGILCFFFAYEEHKKIKANEKIILRRRRR